MNSVITFHDKALALLYRYRDIRSDIQYGAPYEMTQDGIANTLRISRSHASIVLGRMEDAGEISFTQCTVKGSTRMHKKRIYFLTELGINQYFIR